MTAREAARVRDHRARLRLAPSSRHDRELADTLQADRLKRGKAAATVDLRCVYCGAPSRGKACGAHSDLPALDTEKAA